MNCTECREQLITYIEGLAQKGLEQEICAHLGMCDACQQEEKAMRGLQDRLVTQGQGMSTDTLETAVLGRIVREQKSRMNRADQASAAVKLRSIIMKSSISRIAMAAAVVVACLIGVSMFRSTSSITLAGVLDRINHITAYMYQTSMSLTVPNGTGGHINQEVQATTLISRDHGNKSIMETRDVDTGEITHVDHYMLTHKQAAIMVMHEQKQYAQMELNETLVDSMEKQTNDPRAMINQILKCEHISLGRSTIDGIEVEGFQTTDPAYMGVMLGQVDVKLWVHAETWLPYRIEMDTRMGETTSSQAVFSDFQWDAPVDVAEFDPVFPDDYSSLTSTPTKMPAFNEATAIKGLGLCAGLNGQYPQDLSLTSLNGYLAEIMKNDPSLVQALAGKDQALKQEAGERLQETLMPILSIGGFYNARLADDKYPAYHGKIVTPQDADQVLLRWKVSDDEYRVIFGDLHAETVSTDTLTELERALPQ
jgi:outer membrane lipoprotein-sorting protein